MEKRTIFDLVGENLGNEEFDREDYKIENSSNDVFEFVRIEERSWNKKVDNLIHNYPIPYWSFIAIITIFVAWILIKCVWKLIKLIIYQIVYTIVKAIKDAGKQEI